ncbi:MAG TPA: hypothetical protein VKK79_19775, partial [Candidatus Lokiarchaeia archaeon]|nr:hypothetical protein [Candidatus Lokiarchaeia archaeon]
MSETPDLKNWYHVSFNEQGFSRNVAFPGKDPWSDFAPWDRIIRVCFKGAEIFLGSDEIYVFT